MLKRKKKTAQTDASVDAVEEKQPPEVKPDKNTVVILQRDVQALMVPSGAHILLREGTEVRITQELGNSFTLNVYGNLARIDGYDADAIGRTPPDPLAEVDDDASMEDKVWAMLKTVFDPEIPVNIVDLGLIYECQVTDHPDGGYDVKVIMTLTAPGCGMGPVIAADAQAKVLLIPKVTEANVEIVFDPPWEREMMSDAAKLQLGLL